MMEIKVNDKFILHATNGTNYRINVININKYREPSMKYACDIWDGDGNYAGDVSFVGDDFFDIYEEQFERIED